MAIMNSSDVPINRANYTMVEDFVVATPAGSQLLLVYGADTHCNPISAPPVSLMFAVTIDGGPPFGLDPLATLTHVQVDDFRRVNLSALLPLGNAGHHEIQIQAKISAATSTGHITNRSVAAVEIRGCAVALLQPLRMSAPAPAPKAAGRRKKK
jgi:hypothetical protein